MRWVESCDVELNLKKKKKRRNIENRCVLMSSPISLVPRVSFLGGVFEIKKERGRWQEVYVGYATDLT